MPATQATAKKNPKARDDGTVCHRFGKRFGKNRRERLENLMFLNKSRVRRYGLRAGVLRFRFNAKKGTTIAPMVNAFYLAFLYDRLARIRLVAETARRKTMKAEDVQYAASIRLQERFYSAN